MFYRSLVIGIIIFFSIPLTVFAQEEPPLEIDPQLPDNQYPETGGYFDLMMEPGESQEISFLVTNNLEEDILLVTEAGNAYSHPTGGILYRPELESDYSRLLEDGVYLSEEMTLEENMTISAQSTEEVIVQLQVPEVEGRTFLGAVHFTGQVEEQESEGEAAEENSEETGIALETVTTYSIAVQMNLPYEQSFDFSLGEAGFIPEIRMVSIEMINNAHRIQGSITGTYSVSDDEGNELFQEDFSDFSMAPKSEINYQIPWRAGQIEPGEYTLKIEGTAASEPFSSEENFIVEDEEAEVAEENNPEPETAEESEDSGLPTWLWITLGAVLLILAFWLGSKLGNKKKKD